MGRAAAAILAITACLASGAALAQNQPQPQPRAPGSGASEPIHLEPAGPAAAAPPGTVVVGPGEVATAPPGAPLLEPDVQVVRFQGPPGLQVEVLAPTPSPVPAGDGGGIITAGLKRGIGYRLKITGIPERPGRRALSRHRDRRPPAPP